MSSKWVPLLTTPVYDPRNVPVEEKKGATMGMSMTEKQGGSDVRQNTTRAEPLVDGSSARDPGAPYALTGHKWFTSAPMSDAFLTLAQTESGLSCFLVPRWLPDGSRNHGFMVQRLKEKAGDKSNASSEVEYDRAWGQLVGREGRGVSTIIEMVVHTRLDCALGSAALMRQAVRSAWSHAQHRIAFGTTLAASPLMAGVIADLALDTELAVASSLRMAAAFDHCSQPGATEEQQAFRRLGTAVTKYLVCKRAVGVVAEAMECHGGNGFVEEWNVARWFRQSPLNSLWEGSGNVQCLDILRTIAKEPLALPSFLRAVSSARGQLGAGFDAHLDELGSFAKRVARGEVSESDVSLRARSFIEALGFALEGHLLVEKGDEALLRFFRDTRVRDGATSAGDVGANRSYGSPALGSKLSSKTVQGVLDRQ